MNPWEEIKVGDLGRIVTGKTPKTAEKDNYDGEIMFVTPSDNMNSKYIVSTGKRLTEKGKNSVKRSIIPAGTVCVSCIGSDLGKVVITTEECVTNQQINSIVVNTNKYDTDFVYYSMLLLGKELNYHSKISTAVPIVNKSSFSSFSIRCPSLETQKKISEILSSIDNKIINNESINQNLLQQAAALFDNTLQQSTSVSYVNLGSLGDVKGGKRLPKGVNLITQPNTHPYIRVRDLNNVVFASLSSDYEYVDDETQKAISRYITSTGDVLISIVGTIGLTAIVDSSLNNANLTENCVKVTALNVITPEYLLLYLRSALGVEEISKGTVGAVQQKLPIKNIQTIKVPILPKSELEPLSEILRAIFNQISVNVTESKSLALARDTLLPKLISGELDVSEIEI